MRTLALTTALALQLTGLWSYLPATARDRIAATAVSPRAAAPATTPPATAVASLSLPLRISTTGPVRLDSNTSAIAIDRATAATLYAKDSGKQRPIASITKLMTALVILSRHSPDELVTIGTLPEYDPSAEVLGLQPGEIYPLGELVRASLVISGNDAADALAIYDAGSITKFAAQMNRKLADWDITGARFNNASGLIDDGNYATADALARLSLLALQNSFIRDAIRQPTATLTSTDSRVLSGTTTNKLLSTGRYYGIKTGYTLASGECFVGLTKVDGHEVITVILGSPNRFGETETLVNWISRNYQWL